MEYQEAVLSPLYFLWNLKSPAGLRRDDRHPLCILPQQAPLPATVLFIVGGVLIPEVAVWR